MDSRVYVNNDNIVENYFVRVDEEKLKKVQAKADKLTGKGKLLTKVGPLFCMNEDTDLFFKKVEIVSKKYLREGQFCDYCCPDVYTASVYEIKYYAYKQSELSKLCDKLLEDYNKIDLSRAIKAIFEFTSSNEEEMILADEVIDCIQLKRINTTGLAKQDLTINQQESLLKRIINVIRNKPTNIPVIVVSGKEYEADLEYKIRSMECYAHAWHDDDPNFRYSEDERKDIKKKILDSLPTKILISKTR